MKAISCGLMRRAFVLQLAPQTSEDPWAGRIEHVDSGQTQHFKTLEEAVDFIRRVSSEMHEAEPVCLESLETKHTNDNLD